MEVSSIALQTQTKVYATSVYATSVYGTQGYELFVVLKRCPLITGYTDSPVRAVRKIKEFNPPGRELEQPELGIIHVLEDLRKIESGWRRSRLEEIPDVLLRCRVIHPLSLAVCVDRLRDVRNVGKRNVRVMRKVLGFERMRSGACPSGRALPDRMEYSRPRPAPGVHGGHAAPHHRVNARQEFFFDLGEC